MKKEPIVSIVASSRNDNHGGDMTKRMRIFVRGLIHQSNKFKVPVELIMVEWNPPKDKPLLKDVLPQPKEGDYLQLRYIIVSPEIHDRYDKGDKIPLYQMIAKNVGIRRAKADFVLCTNVDLLFSDGVFEKLADNKLDKDTYYRANRCDVPNTISEDWTVEGQLAFSQANISVRLGKNQLYDAMKYFPPIMLNYPRMVMAVNNFVKWTMGGEDSPNAIEASIDTVASGDFTLMHKDAWEDIEGYLETDLYSLHIDSLALLGARALGYKQVIWPHYVCTYHMEHDLGWENMDPLKKLKFSFERPGLDFSTVFDAGMELIRRKVRLGMNKPDWGLMNEDLQEIVFN